MRSVGDGSSQLDDGDEITIYCKPSHNKEPNRRRKEKERNIERYSGFYKGEGYSGFHSGSPSFVIDRWVGPPAPESKCQRWRFDIESIEFIEVLHDGGRYVPSFTLGVLKLLPIAKNQQVQEY